MQSACIILDSVLPSTRRTALVDVSTGPPTWSELVGATNGTAWSDHYSETDIDAMNSHDDEEMSSMIENAAAETFKNDDERHDDDDGHGPATPKRPNGEAIDLCTST